MSTSVATTEQREEARKDNLRHIFRVRELMADIQDNLSLRAAMHDRSKLEDPELEAFAQMENLRELKYGSDEYRAKFKEEPFVSAIAHHYRLNNHHPEHYANGIDDMDLMSITEMLCDWKAASERHNNQPFAASFIINKQRFGIDYQLYAVLVNTAISLDMISEAEAEEYCF